MSTATGTLPPPTSDSPDLVYIEPAIPPGVSPDTEFQIKQSARQHYERRVDSRALTAAMLNGFAAVQAEVAAVKADVASGRAEVAEVKVRLPGPWLQRFGILFAASVVLILLFAVLQLRGVNTAQAVQDTRSVLTPLATGAATGLASPAPLPAASVSPAPPPASPSAPQNAPESHGEPAPTPAPVGEPWHEGEGPTR